MADTGDLGNLVPRPLASVDFWLPTDLSRRTRLQAKLRNVALPVFLRKSVEVHRCHHVPDTPPENAYPDLSELTATYETWQADENAGMMSEIVRDVYLTDLADAQSAGREPAETGFSVITVALVQDLSDYLETEAAQLLPDTIQAAGIIAVHELCTLYEYIGPPKTA